MSNIQNQKSGLARLMATENLTVQHAKTHTASFDPKRRILTVPIWEKTSTELYDLLVGHEVGHAIDTPRDGWHGAVHDRGANYKGFLNVVEDARIEKRQKRRYPGLRRSFVVGFGELMGRDFFGLKGRDINNMTFIDRLNVYSKSGYTLDNIQFNKKEQDFVRRVQLLETWDDVLKLTEEIWDYSKDEQFQLNMPQDYEFEFTDEDGEGEEMEIDGEQGDTETDGKGKQKAKAKSDDQKGDEDGKGSAKPNGETEDGDDDGEDDVVNRFKESRATNVHQEPRCETDENYRRNEATLIDKKARDYIYVNLPTPVLKNIITPAKRVQELLTKEFSEQTNEYEIHANALYNSFRKKNERYIGLLAKEFEMRKAASKFAKAKTAETGDLDIGKIFKYQIDDNIFKRVMKVPKGKSHGLILLLDKSGSMSDNLTASYEQILILALFCRKVNIPFSAYGFGNNFGVRELDYPGYQPDIESFSKKPGELDFDSVYLREMINSNMGNAEFTKAVKNILCLADSWNSRYRYARQGIYFSRPLSDSLSNTPLTEALVACQPILNEFRKSNNLDIVNLCVVHDGDADDTCRYFMDSGSKGYASHRYANVVLVDKKSKLQIDVSGGGDDSMRIAVAKWLSETTGAKIIGFYLAPENNVKSALRHRLYNDEINQARVQQQKDMWRGNQIMSDVYSKYTKILRTEKFVESNNPGYESFFIIPGDEGLSTDDAEFQTEATGTAALAKAFGKYTKARQVNRVLVSRFIGMIAV